MNAGERPAEDRRNALYMRARQNIAAARLTMHFGVAAGLTAVLNLLEKESYLIIFLETEAVLFHFYIKSQYSQMFTIRQKLSCDMNATKKIPVISVALCAP